MKYLNYNNEVITVYEYEEAEELLRELGERFSDDITMEKSKRRGRTAFYNYPCSFDIETTTIVPGQLGYEADENAPPIAFPYLYQFNIYGYVIMVRFMEEALDVFRWSAEYFNTGTYTKLIFFDHNLNYEWSFFKDVWEVEEDGSFALDEHHPVTIYLKSGLIFRDSYKMTNMSLLTLTKDWSTHWIKEPELMNYTAIRTPYDELDENTLIYSALDVLSLSDAIKPFLKARSEDIWTKCPTSTSFVRRKLKKRIGIGVKNRGYEQRSYINLLKNMKMDVEQFTLLRELARGGNTHANRFYVGKELYDLCHFDITSSYPTQMVCYAEYPLGAFIDLGDIEIKELLDVGEEYCIICRVALINPRIRRDKVVPVPYIATAICNALKGKANYSDNGRYLDGAEELVLSVFGIELPIIISQYDFDDIIILKAYAAPKGYLPDIVRNFILELYKDKTELKGLEGMEIEYSLSKSELNGVYGMAYTMPIRTTYIFRDGNIEKEPEKDLEEELEKYQNSISYFLPYSWGCMTACLGRIMLQKLIDCISNPDGTTSFVYADTDSVFALHARKSRKQIKKLEQELAEQHRKCGLQIVYNDRNGKPHELGSIEEEPFIDKFKTYGAKKYVTVEGGKLNCTIAGVPKKTGAKVIGKIENFKLGMNFPGTETGKLTIWYNPDEGILLHDKEGRPIRVRANAAMLPCNYLLGLSDDFMTCLWYENISNKWEYKMLSE